MEEELKSEGKCLYCNQMLSKKEIGKHIAKHLSEREKTDAGDKAQTYCHVEVEAAEMFLHLLVKGNATMQKIDDFLRDIWLECCGHLSEFGSKTIKVKMSHKVKDVLQPKVKIYHDYDFGSTTRVFLKGLKQYELNLKENIVLLSRNEPLKFMCKSCRKEIAINLCTVCCYEEFVFFCKKCSKKHEKVCSDFADYSCAPIINSPRMGECGYTGGSIDLERDGVYKEV